MTVCSGKSVFDNRSFDRFYSWFGVTIFTRSFAVSADFMSAERGDACLFPRVSGHVETAFDSWPENYPVSRLRSTRAAEDCECEVFEKFLATRYRC